MLARCWRDSLGGALPLPSLPVPLSTNYLVYNIGGPRFPASRIEHPYRTEAHSEGFVEARAQVVFSGRSWSHPPLASRIPAEGALVCGY